MKQWALLMVISSSILSVAMERAPEWDGDAYDEHAIPQYEIAQHYLKKISLAPNATILDVGCGSGKITHAIAQMPGITSVHGIDLSESMIQTASRKYGQEKNLAFSIADAQHLTYEDQFTNIVSFNCLHWVKDKLAVFNGIRNALQKGGSFFVAMSAKQEKTEQLRASIISNLIKSPAWECLKNINLQEQWYMVTKEELERLIDHIGFKNVLVSEEDSQVLFKGKKELATWMAAWIEGFLKYSNLSEINQDALVHDVVEEYTCLLPAADDGSIPYPMPQLIAQGIK